jgi:cytoskeletal protein RodZ
MEGNMKKVIIGLACAVVAPFAFAQTTTTTEQTTTAPATTTTTSTTYTSGVVTTYEPGKTIVVRDEREGPISFALKAPVRVVDKAGHVISRALTPKDHVRVYYTGAGETRVVEHVEVED